MRTPYPFKTPVNLDAGDVKLKVLVDMPVPLNLSVHMANEHQIGDKTPDPMDRYVAHMYAHVYGEFREGSEHYHVRDETA